MRILSKVFLILAAGFSGIVIHSCCEGYAYKWVYIIAENLEINQSTEDSYTGNDSIPGEFFGIRVHFFEKKLMTYSPSLFLNNLQATSCDEIYPVEDSILDIRILTLNPFNSSTGSGADVSEYFIERYYEHTLEEEIIRINEDDFSVVDFIDVTLNDNTIIESVHQFVINVYLSDNRILSDTTKPVKLY
jgi:hypothetical protein